MEKYRVLEEGLVLYKSLANVEEQIEFLKMMDSLRLKNEQGEWNMSDNRGNKRGRSFDKIDDLPVEIKEMGIRAKTTIENLNTLFLYPEFSHLLVNAYPSSTGMAWHQDDIGKHDGEKGAPVYILSIGNDALFKYRVTQKGEDKSILLESGDLLVFTGPLRLMYHCVKEVYQGSFNKKYGSMGFECNVRYSLTYRTATLLSDEDYNAAQTESYNQKREDLSKMTRGERKKDYQKRIQIGLTSNSQ